MYDAGSRRVIRRFLIHVLPHGFHRIRHFGLFASKRRAAHLAKLQALLETRSAPPAVKAAYNNAAMDEAFPCPAVAAVCG